MLKYGRPPLVAPASNTFAMFGCSIDDAGPLFVGSQQTLDRSP
jgi:hypothetical protein